MTKIFCADISCKYNGKNSVCTAKVIALSWHSIETVNNGRQEYNRCKTREESERYIELKNRMDELRKKEEDGQKDSV